ncbi:unnamed protein product, partial [Didymodactylos carnosus]
ISCPFTPLYKKRHCENHLPAHEDAETDEIESTTDLDLSFEYEYDEPQPPTANLILNEYDSSDPDDQPSTICQTDKTAREKNPRSAGAVAAVFNCGIIFALVEIFGSESITQ